LLPINNHSGAPRGANRKTQIGKNKRLRQPLRRDSVWSLKSTPKSPVKSGRNLFWRSGGAKKTEKTLRADCEARLSLKFQTRGLSFENAKSVEQQLDGIQQKLSFLHQKA
jgi:hypothetical protein